MFERLLAILAMKRLEVSTGMYLKNLKGLVFGLLMGFIPCPSVSFRCGRTDNSGEDSTALLKIRSALRRYLPPASFMNGNSSASKENRLIRQQHTMLHIFLIPSSFIHASILTKSILSPYALRYAPRSAMAVMSTPLSNKLLMLSISLHSIVNEFIDVSML